MAATEGSEWDLEKLTTELQKHTEIRDGLLHTTLQLQHSVQSTEQMVEGVSNEASVWHDRYLQQQAHNQQLGVHLSQLERRLEELRGQQRELVNDEEMLRAYKDMSDVTLRQLLRRLERERGEVEWQLRDWEWRLDQEATAVHKAEEEKKVLVTELNQATMKLGICKKHHPPATDHNPRTKARDHLLPPPIASHAQTPHKPRAKGKAQTPHKPRAKGKAQAAHKPRTKLDTVLQPTQ